MNSISQRLYFLPLNIAIKSVLLGLASIGIATPIAYAASVEQQNYLIKAGTLTEVLNEFAMQSDVLFSADAKMTSGLKSHGLSGVYSVEQGFKSLLTPHGLDIEKTIEGYRLVKKLQTQVRDMGQLRIIDVTATGTANRDPNIVQLPVIIVDAEDENSYTVKNTSTATGLNLSLRETPQSISVMTRQNMDDFNQQTLKDVMNHTPGVSINQIGDMITFYARGASIDNFQTDGSRVVSPADGAAGINPTLRMDDMALYEQVEVLKGSAGLLQGDGYPTATVNMIRKKPTNNFQASIGASVGSWDAYRTDIDISGPLTQNGNIRGRVVAAFKDADTFRDYESNRNALIFTTLDIDLTPTTLLNVGVEYQQRKSEGISFWAGTQAYDNLNNNSYNGLVSRSWNPGTPWSYNKQNSLGIFGSLEHVFDNGWQVKLRANYDNKKTPDWIGAAAYAVGLSTINRYKDMESETKNINLDIKKAFELFGRTHDLLLGFDYSKNDYQLDVWRIPVSYLNNENTAQNELLSDPVYYTTYGGSQMVYPEGNWDIRYLYRSDTLRKGYYFASRLNPTDNLKIIVGTRLSDYVYNYSMKNVYQGANDLWSETHIREKSVFTPYAGIVYDLNKYISLYGSYANVFQPVTVQDEEGKTLDPREGTTYEIGSKAEFYDNRLNIALSHFWKRWENTYERSGGKTPTGNDAYRNINGVMEHGYELELSGALTDHWQAQGSYVMNNSDLDAGYLPKHQFKLNTTYNLNDLIENVTVGASVRWQSETAAGKNALLKQDSYWLLDLMGRYRVNQKLTASLNINNVLDKKYFAGTYVYGLGGQQYTWGEPRNATLSLKYKF